LSLDHVPLPAAITVRICANTALSTEYGAEGKLCGDWVAEVRVAADGLETICLDAQVHLAAGCLAALYFSSEGGAVQETGGLDCLTSIGGYASGKGEQRRVGVGAIETVEEGRGDDLDLWGFAYVPESEKTYSCC
jgi:hypothetical protein